MTRRLSISIDELRQVTRSLVRELGALSPDKLGAESLTLAEGHALKEIQARKELSIKELSQSLLLDHSTTSRMISKLDKARLIRITTDPADKRGKIISLSAKGVQALDTLDEKTNSFLLRALSQLSTAEQKNLVLSLTKYRDALKGVR